jgi:alkylated DNA repair dioxygenase AlkB
VTQLSLFGSEPGMPEGFIYRPETISPQEEGELVARFADLDFEPFEFHGHLGHRRVVSFGARYDFGRARLTEAHQIPEFLAPFRQRAAEVAGLEATDIHHVLVTEYPPGAGIGWHRDKAVFDKVVGLSLLEPCLFRFRRRNETGWDRATAKIEPRSAYLLDGEARSVWEHSIPPMGRLRYSITFRSLR